MTSDDTARLTKRLNHWYPEHGKYGQLIPGILELNQILSKPQEAGIAPVITGSCVDQGVLCSHRMDSIDVDVMIGQVIEIFSKQQTEKLMKPAEGFPGYIIIDATDDWVALHCYSLWVTDKRLASSPRKVLSPEKAKDHIGTDLGRLLPDFVERKQNKVSQRVQQVIVTLAAQDRAEDLETLVDPTDVEFFPLVLDCISAAEAEGWPTAAEAFLHRKRYWPDKKTISAIQEGGFHIVPNHPSDGDPDLHWRLSFSLAEAELTKAMSNFQRKCFCLIKLIVYDVLKDFKRERKKGEKDLAVTTYHSKTALFWSCENKTGMWRREDLGECMLSLLDDLLKCLSEEKLPMYFIPENNILHYVNKDHLREEVGLLKGFRQTLTLEPSAPWSILPQRWRDRLKDVPPFITGGLEEGAPDIIKCFIDNIAKAVLKVCRQEQGGLTNSDLAKKCVYDSLCESFPKIKLLLPNQKVIFPPGEDDISTSLIQPVLRGKTLDLPGILKIMAKAMECVFNTISFRYHGDHVAFHAQSIRK